MSELRITKEINFKDDRKVLINIREENTRLKIYGYNGSDNHIVIYLEDLKELIPKIEEEVNNINKKIGL